jgi:hypothetical protein
MSDLSLYELSVYQGTEQVSRTGQPPLYQGDVNTQQQLDDFLPWWRQLDSTRQSAILSLTAVFGPTGLFGIDGFLSALEQGEYSQAAQSLRETAWYSSEISTNTQVPPGGPIILTSPKSTINPEAVIIVNQIENG